MRKTRLLSATACVAMLIATTPSAALDAGRHLSQIALTDELLDKFDGTGATVAVLDGFVAADHPELDQLSHFTFENRSYNGVARHGTHVAGIIGANRDGRGSQGVAPGANLVSVGVFDDSGWARQSFTAIFREARAAGASIANGSFSAGETPMAGPGELSAIRAVRDDLLFVRAAGNQSQASPALGYRGDVSKLTNLIYVGSVNSSNRLSSFSNSPGEACFSDQSCRDSEKIKHRFMVAPGEAVSSTVPGGGYGVESGTSTAAPQVAGAAALLHGRWAWLKEDPEKTADILFDSATDLGATGVDATYGHGLLNVVAAMGPLTEPEVITQLPEMPETIKPPQLPTTPGRSEPPSSNLVPVTPQDPEVIVAPVAPTEPDVPDEPILEPTPEPAPKTPVTKVTKRRSRFAARHNALRANSLFNRRLLSELKVTAFDGYGRDFTTSAASYVVETDSSAAFVSRWQRRELAAASASGNLSLSFGRSGQLTPSDGPVLGLSVTAGFGAHQPLGFTAGDALDSGFFQAGSTGHNAFAALASTGFHGGAVYQFANGLSFSAGVQGSNGTGDADASSASTYAYSASANLPLTDQLSAFTSFSSLNESGAILGASGDGVFDFGEGINSQSVTLGFNWKPSDRFAILGSYTLGRTRQFGAGIGGAYLSDALVADAWHLSLTGKELFAAGDRFTLGVSQPLRARSGQLAYQSVEVIDRDTGALGLVDQSVDLAARSRQIDLGVAYSQPILADGVAVEARAFASHNAGHVKGANDFGVGARVTVNY